MFRTQQYKAQKAASASAKSCHWKALTTGFPPCRRFLHLQNWSLLQFGFCSKTSKGLTLPSSVWAQCILAAKDAHPVLGSAKRTLMEWQCHNSETFQEAISLSIPPCQGISATSSRSRRRQRVEEATPVDLKTKRRNTNKLVAKLKEFQKAVNNKNAGE